MSNVRSYSITRGVVGRVCAAGVAAAVVLLWCGECPASTPTSRPAGFRPPLPKGNGPGTTDLLWHMLAATVVILVLGALAFFVIKRLLPKITRATGKRISVLESAYLGPRKAVHLLQVGDKRLLVASSPEGVVMLDDVSGAFAEDYADVARRVNAE